MACAHHRGIASSRTQTIFRIYARLYAHEIVSGHSGDEEEERERRVKEKKIFIEGTIREEKKLLFALGEEWLGKTRRDSYRGRRLYSLYKSKTHIWWIKRTLRCVRYICIFSTAANGTRKKRNIQRKELLSLFDSEDVWYMYYIAILLYFIYVYRHFHREIIMPLYACLSRCMNHCCVIELVAIVSCFPHCWIVDK